MSTKGGERGESRGRNEQQPVALGSVDISDEEEATLTPVSEPKPALELVRTSMW